MANYGGEVKTEKGGITYTGTFTVEDDIITVRWEDREKSTQVGGSKGGGEEALAKIVLGELVEGR